MPKSRSEHPPVAELFPPQGQWTEAHYFALPDTNRHVELSDGRLIVPPHPTRKHQAALEALFVKLWAFVKERGLGELHVAPLPVRLWPGKIREPDIFFLAKEHVNRGGERAFGVPDLVVEVLSPSTWEIDRNEKFFEYAKAGVKEYWLVDPDEKTVEVYFLQGNAFAPLGKFHPGQRARSQLLAGFEIDPAEIFSE